MQQRLGLAPTQAIAGTSTRADACAVLETLLALCSGATLQRGPAVGAADAPSVAQWAQTKRPDVMFGSPATWHALIAAGWGEDNGTLQAVCVAAQPQDDLMHALASRCDVAWQVCGPVHGSLVAVIERFDANGQRMAATPAADAAAWVLDERGQPCPIGVRGDLWFGASGPASDFGARARANPTPRRVDGVSGTTDALLLRSGLRARWTASGQLELERTADRHLRIHGHDVDPAQVEVRLLAIPGVMRAAAVVQQGIDGRAMLVAYVQPSAGTLLDPSTLQATLVADLPHRLHPHEVIVLAQLPLLADGHVDVAALSVASTAPARSTAIVEAPAPSEGERFLVTLWQDILAIPHADPGDNFFDLGGHSLAAMLMVARVEKRTRVRLNILKVANSSLRALAAELPASIGSADEPRAGLGQRVRTLFGWAKSTDPKA